MHVIASLNAMVCYLITTVLVGIRKDLSFPVQDHLPNPLNIFFLLCLLFTVQEQASASLRQNVLLDSNEFVDLCYVDQIGHKLTHNDRIACYHFDIPMDANMFARVPTGSDRSQIDSQ
jgi:hypothetical protein